MHPINTAYWTCSGCGKYFSNANGTTEIAKDSWIIPKTGHSYKTSVTPATMKADGKITKTCEKCGNKGKATSIKKIQTVSLSNTTYRYNGSVKRPQVTAKDSAGKTIDSKYYTVTYSNKNSKNVDSYTAKIVFKGNYKGTKTLSYRIIKADNPLTLSTTKKEYKRSALTGKKTFNIGASKNQGKVTYTPDSKATNAKITVSSKGVVTVPKKCKAGTYTISVKAAGNDNYKPVTKTVTIKVINK